MYNDIRKPSDIEHFYKPPLIQTILKEGALAQAGLAAYQNRDGQHSDSGLFPSAYGAAITTQNNNNTNSFLRNPFFFNQPFMTQPWNNAIQPWHTMLPSWNNLYNQKPTMFEMQMKIGQLVSFFPQSELSIKSSFEMAFGGKVTSSDFYSALSSCPSVVNFRGYLCSSTALSNLSLSSFGCLLGSTSLSSTYNSFNSLYYNLLMHNLGFIGGVAAKVGVIKAPFIDDANIIAFKSEDGKQPFSDQQLKQICAELKGAIFTYNTFPFFSLHFNDKGQLYPVIHPAYNGTEVGKVIGFLDYLMKCYLNGAGYSEDFLQKWPNNQNSNPDHLKANLIDFKKSNPDYMSLREYLCINDLEANKDEKNIDPFSVKANKFQTSFRIISKLNQVSKQDNLLVFDSGFEVQYTIETLPDYQQFLDNYHNEHGVYPEDFQKLNAIYQQFAKKIEQDLPNFTMCKEYFEKLKVITSLSYYYNSLKQEGREPTIKSVKTQAAFPRVMPSIPVRYYQKHDIKITLTLVLKLMLKLR